MRSGFGGRVISIVGMVLAGAALASCTREPAKTDAPAAMTKAERGEYLVWVLGCNDCHTPGGLYGMPDRSRQLSGSELGWEGPWGVTYPRNLTPDPETGIAAWSEADIITAIRTGKRPNGTAILPPMPWPWYARLTDEDAQAVAAYLKSIPPVRHKAPDALPPGGKPAGPVLTLPAPPAWDQTPTP